MLNNKTSSFRNDDEFILQKDLAFCVKFGEKIAKFFERILLLLLNTKKVEFSVNILPVAQFNKEEEFKKSKEGIVSNTPYTSSYIQGSWDDTPYDENENHYEEESYDYEEALDEQKSFL